MLCRATVLGLALVTSACTEQVLLHDVPEDSDSGVSDLAIAKDTAPPPDNDPACGLQWERLDYRSQAAQLMVLLDRSTSMQTSFSNESRESAAETAIATAVSTYQTKIKFGYEHFPADSADKAYASCGRSTCCAGSVRVAPQYSAYNSMIGPLRCGDSQSYPCPTPTADSPSHAALTQVRGDDKFTSSNDERYVLLVTSSNPSCSELANDEETCTIALGAASELGNMGIRIVVLNLGDQPESSSCLARISQTGSLLPSPANTRTLYTVSTVYSLNSAMTEFVSAVARTGCTLASSDVLPSQAELVVSIGKTQIPQVDNTNDDGWSFANWARTKIIFSGWACDQYLKSKSDDLSTGYYCSTCGGSNACPGSM